MLPSLEGSAVELLGVMLCEGKPLLLPFYGSRVPAGFPSPAEDYLESQLDLRAWNSRPARIGLERPCMEAAGVLSIAAMDYPVG